MAMDTDAYFEKLLLLSVKQQDIEKSKRLKICELDKRNVRLRNENEALVAKLKSLEEEQYEQWKYIDELYQITVSEIRNATGDDGGEVQGDVHSNAPPNSDVGQQPVPPFPMSLNEEAADDFLQSLSTFPSETLLENKQPVIDHTRPQSTTIPPSGMCYTKHNRKLVPRNYCLQYNDTGGFCGVRNCPYKHILFEEEQAATSRDLLPYQPRPGGELTSTGTRKRSRSRDPEQAGYVMRPRYAEASRRSRSPDRTARSTQHSTSREDHLGKYGPPADAHARSSSVTTMRRSVTTTTDYFVEHRGVSSTSLPYLGSRRSPETARGRHY